MRIKFWEGILGVEKVLKDENFLIFCLYNGNRLYFRGKRSDLNKVYKDMLVQGWVDVVETDLIFERSEER